jgi:hypothetical protein
MHALLFSDTEFWRLYSVHDERLWGISGMTLTKENQNTQDIAWPGIESRTPLREASDYLPQPWRNPLTMYNVQLTHTHSRVLQQM